MVSEIIWLYAFEIFGFLVYLICFAHGILHWKLKQMIAFYIPCTIYGWFIEAMGVHLWGTYHYNSNFVISLWGVPVAVALGWAGIIYCAVYLVRNCKFTVFEKCIMSAFLALSIDLGMDIVACNYGLWYWTPRGFFFGVPLFNFVGWFLVVSTFVVAQELINRKSWNWKTKTVVSTASIFPCYGLTFIILIILVTLQRMIIGRF